MLSSRSGVTIAVASAAVIGYSTYLIFRQLSLSPGPSHSDHMPNMSGDGEDDSTLANFKGKTRIRGLCSNGSPGPIFYKAPNANEEAIYRILGSHPRIVKYLGGDPLTGHIMLSSLRNGALLFHLRAHPVIPLATRLTWAIEIAQGVAHLHARDIIWAGPHLANILLTDDYHAVLCDFGLSVHKAPYFYDFTIGPPPIYSCPFGYCAKTPRRNDIFGLGVILFVLLSERFPFHKDLFPSTLEEIAVLEKHEEITDYRRAFDKLPPSLDSYFGNIVDNCFTIKYQSADIFGDGTRSCILSVVEGPRAGENLGSPNSVSVDIPYPQRPVHLPIEQVQHQYTLPPLDLSDDPFQYN
ncbi:kinase-like domain-containing protein [Flammula alnicola]|nr:kinase-like domain-containing protein [Flammula alnicola]